MSAAPEFTVIPVTRVEFTVPGEPKPKGSLRCLGRGRHIEDNPASSGWLRACVTVCHKAAGAFPEGTPVAVTARFYVRRPKTLPKRVTHSVRIGPGDVDKLARNLLDALTRAKVFHDDSQVVDLFVQRRFDSDPRTEVEMTALT